MSIMRMNILSYRVIRKLNIRIIIFSKCMRLALHTETVDKH